MASDLTPIMNDCRSYILCNLEVVLQQAKTNRQHGDGGHGKGRRIVAVVVASHWFFLVIIRVRLIPATHATRDTRTDEQNRSIG